MPISLRTLCKCIIAALNNSRVSLGRIQPVRSDLALEIVLPVCLCSFYFYLVLPRRSRPFCFVFFSRQGLVTAVLCNVHGSLEHEIPRRSFLSRRAIDGTRGRKYFDPDEEGSFDSYGSAGGQYDPYEEKTDLSDIRRNVPGEPGIDYPAHTTLPQTGFTCEGRSRGYYADEVAGCQVFHVCHDVLVSSFLCPIGSIFSQKLLTCDWWTKVDCSSTQKYIGVNRNSYQQDDDEMIRNAYAMISLQSGKDVTKDGLVDPDRTGSVVDYQRSGVGVGLTDYSTGQDSVGNDLRNNYDDYLTSGIRQFLPNYNQRQRRPENARNYPGKYYTDEKSRSPYHDSPIIRIQKIGENRRDYGETNRKDEYRENYRRPNEFTNQFQPSYAPTVPTVTTTTRRFYSPTIPTTYRPSTLAYNKLDQLVDSSNNYYSQTRARGFVTPPTRIFSKDDGKRREIFNEESRKEILSARKIDRDEDYPEESYEDIDDDVRNVREKNDESTRSKYEIRIIDDFPLNRTHSQDDRNSFFDRTYQTFGNKEHIDESVDDIETRGSIGLGHALHQPLRRISIQEQDPVEQTKNESTRSQSHFSPRISSPRHFTSSQNGEDNGDYQYTLTKPESIASLEKADEETTEQYERDAAATTTMTYESQEFTINYDSRTTTLRDQETTEKEVNDDPNIFVPSTTPSSIESTVDATARSASTIQDTSDILLEEGRGTENSSSISLISRSFNEKESIVRTETGSSVLRPAEFLKPPNVAQSTFRINVPDTPSQITSFLSRHSTIDDETYTDTRTTETPRFHSTLSDARTVGSTIYDGIDDLKLSIDHRNEKLTESSTFSIYPRAESSSTVSPLSSSFGDQTTVNVPVTEIVPPIVDYNDGFGDFVAPDESKSLSLSLLSETQKSSNLSSISRNDTEKEILGRYNSEFQFTIRDAINSNFQAKTPCSSSSDHDGELCATTAVYDNLLTSTPIPLARSTSERINEASTKFTPLHFLGTTISPGTHETVTARPQTVTVSPIFETFGTVTRNLETSRSTVVAQTKGIDKNEKLIESSTPENLFKSLGPETLKHIEETIEKNNSPYQVSLTVNKDDELVSIGDDVIGRLIAERGKTSSTSNEKIIDRFEVIKSVEPEIQASSDIRAMSTSNLRENNTQSQFQPFINEHSKSISVYDSTSDSIDSKKLDSNASNLSLLQLMAELLKLDRFPRPFAPADSLNLNLRSIPSIPLYNPTVNPTVNPTTQKSFERLQTRTIPRDVVVKTHFEEKTATTPYNSFTESIEKISRPVLKDQILEQLKENFGQPLYSMERHTTLSLPDVQRNIDFQTGHPLKNSRYDESSGTPETLTTHLFSSVQTSTTTPKTTTTEKAVVKTEFVPSIGFSFDTDEGREEYVEAVLGGLIDEHSEENDRKDTTTLQTVHKASNNETSRIT